MNARPTHMWECLICGNVYSTYEEASNCCKNNVTIDVDYIIKYVTDQINNIESIKFTTLDHLPTEIMKCKFIYNSILKDRYVLLIDKINYDFVFIRDEKIDELKDKIEFRIEELNSEVQKYAKIIHENACDNLDYYFKTKPSIQIDNKIYSLNNLYFLRYWYNGCVRDDRVIDYDTLSK